MVEIQGNAVISTSSKAILPRKSYFQPLAFPNNDLTEINRGDDVFSGVIKGISPSWLPKYTQHKSPSVVVQKNPESNMILLHRQENMKIVPGNSSYSSKTSDGKWIGIFGASMIKKLLENIILKDINQGKAKALPRCYFQ